eukprot:TRINITY_DN3305_c0_g1_i1.p1 TRINITY_DN3305_c0_g1~~TRINITY_DN3305_c0_g1_i1.p1  ORF type:complete len:119 (+),score=37.73 TRINITY_DN3305_c0_g1_i1:219-575(+)
MSEFKQLHDLEKRTEVASKIRSKYPDRIPVIVEKYAKSDAPDIDKKKFLVPQDITAGRFMYELRKHMPTLAPEVAISLFVNNTFPPSAEMMMSLYEKHKDEDGFLYITYSGENTFGSI